MHSLSMKIHVPVHSSLKYMYQCIHLRNTCNSAFTFEIHVTVHSPLGKIIQLIRFRVSVNLILSNTQVEYNK